jgi:hypothetical protein
MKAGPAPALPRLRLAPQERHTANEGSIYDKIYIDFEIEREAMARTTGDKSYSLREKRLIAQTDVLKAKVDTSKERLKVKDARIKELQEKLKKAAAKKK